MADFALQLPDFEMPVDPVQRRPPTPPTATPLLPFSTSTSKMSFSDPDGCEWIIVNCPRCTFRVPTDILLHSLTFLDAREVWLTTRAVNRVWGLCSEADMRINAWLTHRAMVVDARQAVTFTEQTSHVTRNTATTAAGVTLCVAIAGVSCASIILAAKIAAVVGGGSLSWVSNMGRGYGTWVS